MQIRVGDSKYDIFDQKVWPLDSISPQIPKFCYTNIAFLLETHCCRHHTSHTHVLQNFYTTWVRGVACQKQRLGPKLEGGWARGASKKCGTPYVFLQPLKLATLNSVHDLGLGLACQKNDVEDQNWRGLGLGSIAKNWDPLLIAAAVEASNFKFGTRHEFRFILPNTSCRTKLGRVWIRRVPLPSPLWWWCNCVFYVPSKIDGYPD